MKRLPKQLTAKKAIQKEEDELVCCGECALVNPIKDRPNLNYKGEPFLSTCKENHLPEDHTRILMSTKHVCAFFKPPQ